MSEHTTIRTAQAQGFSMDYFRFGQQGPGAEAFVILPGLSVQSVMASADAIVEAYQPLAQDYAVYVFDRRNELPPAYTVDAMAGDMAAVLGELGLGQVNLFGTSQGGMVALRMAVDHPELVGRLVLGSTTPRVTDEQFQGISGWARLAEQQDARGLYRAFGEALYPRAVFEQSRGLLDELAEGVSAEELRRFVVLAEATRGFDVSGDLDRIDCPVLLMADADDQVLGVQGSRQLAEALEGRPGFVFYLSEGFGHAAYDLDPAYKDRILRFLKTT